MNNRASNIRVAWIFATSSALLLLFACYFWWAAGTVGKTQEIKVLGAQCVKEFEALGIKANLRLQDHAIVSFQSETDNMQDRVKASSVGIGRCAGYRLVEFCAGKGCTKPGVFFIMEPL